MIYHLIMQTGMKLLIFCGNKLNVDHPGNSVCFFSFRLFYFLIL
jgi:hypothetical protein